MNSIAVPLKVVCGAPACALRGIRNQIRQWHLKKMPRGAPIRNRVGERE